VDQPAFPPLTNSSYNVGMIRTILIAIALSLAVVGPASAQDFDKGLEAFERGDYEDALRELRPLADKRVSKAQGLLGVMYAQGQGLDRDLDSAVRWFRSAAEQGDAKGTRV